MLSQMILAGLVGGMAAADPTARVDLSAWDPAASDYPVARLGLRLCHGHEDGDVLATAIVTYGRRPGRSLWGHTSMRFLACEGQQLMDVELEYYRMDASIERWLGTQYPDEPWAHDPHLRQSYGKLVLVRNERPADGGFYADELHKNRELIEAWMPWDPHTQAVIYRTLIDRYDQQIERLRRREPLTGHDYKPMGTNCTLHVREALGMAAGQPGSWVGSVFPIETLRIVVEEPGVELVLHPSPSALRHLVVGDAVLKETDRLPTHIWRRRLGRRPRAVVDSALPAAVPVAVQRLLETEDAP